MAKRSSSLSVGLRAAQAIQKGLVVVIPLAIVYGVLLTALDLTLFHMLMPDGNLPSQQDLPRFILPWIGATLGLEILIGPIISAFSVYVGRTFMAGQSGSLPKAVNFALNRYGRMFVPHLAAQLSIQLGMLIVIPGVLFQLQYAFVDAIASLEKESAPLNRSKRLTRGRRRTVFLLFLPWLLISQTIIFADLWALGQGAYTNVFLFFIKMFAFLLYFLTQTSFVILYSDRIIQRQKQKEARRLAKEAEAAAAVESEAAAADASDSGALDSE